MRRFSISLLLLVSMSVSLSAQVNRSGAPVVISTDVIGTPGEAQNLCITMDKRGVMYFGTPSKGIVTYNGLQWGLIPLGKQQNVNALAADFRGTVYAATSSDFGFLQPDRRGDLEFISLAGRLDDSIQSEELQPVISIATDSRNAYFTDRRMLYIYDFISDSLKAVNMNQESGIVSVSTLFTKDDRLFIADNRVGIFEYKDGRITNLPGGNMIRWVKFLTLLPYGKEQILVITVDNGVFLYNYNTGSVKKDLLSEFDNDRLKGGLITSAAIIPGNRFAIGVEGGEGIFIFDFNGKLKQQITAGLNGTPESAVTSMYCDYTSNSQLWFCTPGYINRAYITLPVSEFGSGTGIMNPITDVTVFNGETYVSSDKGLYVSDTDYGDRVQFSKLNDIDNQVFDLLILKVLNKEVLIAATDNGLYRVDLKGEVERVYENFYVTTVRADRNDQSVILAGSGRGIVSRLKYTGSRFVPAGSPTENGISGSVKTIEQAPGGEWWVLTSGPSTLYRLGKTPEDSAVEYGRSRGLKSDTLNYITTIGNFMYVCTGEGVFRYNQETDSFEKDNNLIGESFGNAEITTIFKTPGGDLQVAGHDVRYFDALVTPTSQGHVVFRKQFDFLPDIPTTHIGYIDGNIWIVKGKSIFVIDKGRLGYNYGSFSTFFTAIIAGRDSVLMNESFPERTPYGMRIPSVTQPEGNDPVLRHSLNDISFRWTTTFYVGEEKTEHRYKLEGFDRDWSKWEKRNFKDYTNLPHGDYVFKVKAKTISGLESEESVFRFSVHKSWYQATGARILYFLLMAFIVVSIIRLYTRRLRAENFRLTKMVNEGRAEVALQRKELESGIRYASRIQRAFMPSQRVLSDSIANNFILYMPRDIVSGDFYWMSRKEERLFVVAADCTGHGIPGAFMSLLGISMLEEIVNRRSIHKANEILSEMRKQVITSLKQEGGTREIKDGIDMALLVIDYKRKVVEFAGANIPCFKVRAMTGEETEQWQAGSFVPEAGSIANGKYLLETVIADKMTVGISQRMDQEFILNEWEIEKGVSYYLFTDGYIDQFNGMTGKKFMKRNFKKLLLDVQSFHLTRQRDILEERLKSWMGTASQLDDILVIGLKVE